jgi:3-hydroxybutyryl-CoA dehydrogenase
MPKIETVGIVGAGTMGQGIAQLCASHGFNVLLYDINDKIISDGIEKIERGFAKAVEKGKLTEQEKQYSIQRIAARKNLSSMQADLIIEAAVENLEVKKSIFKELELANGVNTILATNTSSIPVTQIAAALRSPDRFAGLHFFNPAPVMKLVEIISGVATSTETMNTLKEFAKNVKKVAVEAKDSPGFIVNRVARHYYVESLKILEENAADMKTIDALMKSSGFKMGPFELMDLIGVDTNFSVTTSIFEAFYHDAKFRPSRIQQQKVDAGHHGRKSGKGFYDYQ